MALSQESVFSIIYHLRTDPVEYWIHDWFLHGPLLLRWIGTSLVNFSTFQWVGWLIHLPIVRPDALASLFHEYDLPSSIEVTQTPIKGMLTISQSVPTTAETNQFLLGFMNSPALVLSISTTTVLCFRWLYLDFEWIAMLSFFGNFLSNWLVVVAVLFGLDDLVARWYFLTPFTYVGAVIFIWYLVFNWIKVGLNFDLTNEGPFGMNPEIWRGLKIGMTSFTLGLCEQTVMFHKLIQPLSPHQLDLLHGFTSGTVLDHILMHGSYVTGLFVGGLILGTLAIQFGVIPFLEWLIDKKYISQARLYLVIIMMTGASLPYYGLDYVLTRFADFAPDGGWQEQTIFTSTLSKDARKRNIADVSRRDDARPWLEVRNLYPERKWLFKVIKSTKESETTLPMLDFHLHWKAGEDFIAEKAEQLMPTSDVSYISPKLTGKKFDKALWDLVGSHFYQWKDEDLYRQKFNSQIKAIVEFARYRMLILNKIHEKAVGISKDENNVEVLDYSVPFTPIAASPEAQLQKTPLKPPFLRSYYAWALKGDRQQLKKKLGEKKALLEQAALEAKQPDLSVEEQMQRYEAVLGTYFGQPNVTHGIAPKLEPRIAAIDLSQDQDRYQDDDEDEDDISLDTQQTVDRLEGTRAEVQTKEDFINKMPFKDAVWVRPAEDVKIRRLNGEDVILPGEEDTQLYDMWNEEEYPGWEYMHARIWKERAYNNFMFRRLIELDIDSLLLFQPARNFVTDAEHQRLQYHQVALSAYHRSLRDYDASLWSILLEARANFSMAPLPLWRWDADWKVGFRAKSLENYVYDQRFKGSHRVVERLFLLNTPWNPHQGPHFRYDQLLPLEEQDQGDSSNLWHEEIPREVREEVGAYDPFQSQRVPPMFDPVPFYIGWDPILRKSVLTTSRLPQGTARVKLVLPATKTPKWLRKIDFLGIKRFLEETKLYEHVDFVADKDHEFKVHVKIPPEDDPERQKEMEEKQKLTPGHHDRSRPGKTKDKDGFDLFKFGKDKETPNEVKLEDRDIVTEKELLDELDKYYPPSDYRYDPKYQLIMPGWEFKKLPAEPYGFEFEQAVREQVKAREEQLEEIELAKKELKKRKQAAKKAKKEGKQLPQQEPIKMPTEDELIRPLRPETMRILKRQFGRQYQAEELERKVEQSTKSLVSERDTRQYWSPKTWFQSKSVMNESFGMDVGSGSGIDQSDHGEESPEPNEQVIGSR